MITPGKQVTFPFTSDGTSTALVMDLSLSPTNIDFRGVQPGSIQTPTITKPDTTQVAGATFDLVGSVLTITLAAPLPESVDGTLQVYSVAFLLALNSIVPPS
jgi:hypothetical protein